MCMVGLSVDSCGGLSNMAVLIALEDYHCVCGGLS